MIRFREYLQQELAQAHYPEQKWITTDDNVTFAKELENIRNVGDIRLVDSDMLKVLEHGK